MTVALRPKIVVDYAEVADVLQQLILQVETLKTSGPTMPALVPILVRRDSSPPAGAVMSISWGALDHVELMLISPTQAQKNFQFMARTIDQFYQALSQKCVKYLDRIQSASCSLQCSSNKLGPRLRAERLRPFDRRSNCAVDDQLR